ncbi:MAG: hypothetical protein LC792_21795 [Actinobacteria bacterium]|nr:hypothetical protein [Actinomycetota bacterium]
MAEAERSRAAREASGRALVRVVHHYGARPEFVVLGGLVPEMLCAGSAWRPAGTTDVDVQVDLEIACGAVNTARLETALKNAELEPAGERVWRWQAEDMPTKTVVKFELLADLDNKPNEAVVTFDECDNLGAVNLRGTGFASRDVEVRTLTSKVGGDLLAVEVNVTGLAGFLLAKNVPPQPVRRRVAASPWTPGLQGCGCASSSSGAMRPPEVPQWRAGSSRWPAGASRVRGDARAPGSAAPGVGGGPPSKRSDKAPERGRVAAGAVAAVPVAALARLGAVSPWPRPAPSAWRPRRRTPVRARNDRPDRRPRDDWRPPAPE